MASSVRKINRRSVRRAIGSGQIEGTDLAACATCIVALLGLHPSCRNKALQVLKGLEREVAVVLEYGQLRFTTEVEKADAHEATLKAVRQRRATRGRTKASRYGGVRNLQVRTARPLPQRLV